MYNYEELMWMKQGTRFMQGLPEKIKVLCEQTRELTHDFLDYV